MTPDTPAVVRVDLDSYAGGSFPGSLAGALNGALEPVDRPTPTTLDRLGSTTTVDANTPIGGSE